MRLKAVQLAVNSHLPPDLQDFERELDAKSISNLLSEVGKKYPDQYERISKAIADIGRTAAYRQGESLRLQDLQPVIDRDRILGSMDEEITLAKKETRNPEAFSSRREEIWKRYANLIKGETMRSAMQRGNNLAYSVASGARGKPEQLQAMLSTPGIYADYADRTVPIFIRHSLAEGLRPAEYLAGTFGARTSVISTKNSTAKGGDLLKQWTQAAAPLVVTERDCGTTNGIDLPVDDRDLKYRVLARQTNKVPAGTVLTRDAMSHLRSGGRKNVIVRSPLTCQAPEGVCAKCMGVDARGKYPNIGDAVGMKAAQALGEPITQMALNSKHTAGVASQKKEYSGFGVINQFVQSPEVFPDRAAVAEEDGAVSAIDEAPQGGNFVTIGGTQHYVPAGYPVTVKIGEKVEAGDQLSEGLVDPSDIIRLRGLGEGRRYYADRLATILSDSGMPTDRRNVEMIARASLDHVIIDDPDEVGEGVLPDDVLSYNRFAQRYNPPSDTTQTDPKSAVSKYLQTPVLHFTIGTKVTPRIAQTIQDAEIPKVYVSNRTPGFRPELIRLRAAGHEQDDWLGRMHTSYLAKNLNEATTRGLDTDTKSNVHFAPRLAIGEDFAKDIRQTGRF